MESKRSEGFRAESSRGRNTFLRGREERYQPPQQLSATSKLQILFLTFIVRQRIRLPMVSTGQNPGLKARRGE